MRLFCLHEGFYEGVQIRLDQIGESCAKPDVGFIPLNRITNPSILSNELKRHPQVEIIATHLILHQTPR